MSIKNIAIMGGAFDPVHKDHIRVSKKCLELNYCDSVWFMPSPDRWDKQLNASAQDRFAMLDLVVKENENFFISDFEIERGDFRGSYVMLSALQEKYPDYNFRLLVGADSYSGIPHWRDPLHFFGTEYNGTDLLKNFELIVFARNGYETPDKKEHLEKGYAKLFVVDKALGFEGVYASSKIRKELLFNRGKCPEGLEKSVYEYILKNGLYSNEIFV